MKTIKLLAMLLLFVPTQVGHANDPLLTWTWRNPFPPPTISKFAFGSGQFVGVGSYGTIVSSADGASWVSRSSGTYQSLADVAFGNGLFVAMAAGDDNAGVAGAILTSADGVNWIQHSIQRSPGGTPDSFSAIAYGGGQFVAVEYNGAILSSRDGTNWTRQETGDHSLYAMVYGNGIFVALGDSTNGPVVMSFDGAKWVELPPGTEQPVSALAYGNGQFVGVDASGNLVTSVDGATWVDGGTQVSFTEIGYANGLFIASDTANNGNTLSISTNGVNWVDHKSSGPVYVSAMVYGNGRFVAPGGGFVMSSVDGVNWMPAGQSGVQPQLAAIAYGGGQFVAVGDGIMTSTDDGMTWVRREAALTNRFFYGVAYGNGQFAAFGVETLGDSGPSTGSGTILTSADGVNWVKRWGLGGQFYGGHGGVAYGNGLFAAVTGNTTILTSTDGVNWHPLETPALLAIAYGNGKFVGIGDGIMISTNAVDWRQTDSLPSGRLPVLAYGNGRFVILRDFTSADQEYEESLVSSDGENWVKQQWLAQQYAPQAIACGNGQFVAVGSFELDLSRGTIRTSGDGLTWSSPKVVAPYLFHGVAFGNGRFVAVGGGGEILQSGPVINLSVAAIAKTGQLSLALEGPSGLGYRIQTSTDLVAWRDVAQITNAPPQTVITNGLPAAFGHQFYRATVQ